MAVIAGAIGRDAVTQAVISGGAAGAHTVTGIKPTDTLVSVLRVIGGGSDVTDVADLTSEFTISDDDEIDNTDGTGTGSDKLIVTYLSVA